MLIRWLFIFLGLTLFIGGCNNLLSSFAGTHKLRVMDADEIVREGLGDTDYLKAEGVHLGAQVFVDYPKYFWQRPIVVVPLYHQEQMIGVAWQKLQKGEDCDGQDCRQKFQLPMIGMVNPTRRLQAMVQNASSKNMNWKSLTNLDHASWFYLEHQRHPIAWYWNSLMCMGGLLLFIWIERKNIFRNQNNSVTS